MFKNWIFCLVIVLTYLWVCRDNINRNFAYDEVDYMKAAQRGIIANALSENSISFVDFAKLGKAKWNRETAEIERISETVPEPKQDLFFLRHYHMVLPIYYLSLFQHEDYFQEKRQLRISMYVLYVIMVFSVLFFFYRLMKKRDLSSGNFAFLLPLLALSPVTIHVFSLFNMHPFFAIALLLLLMAYYFYYSNKSKLNFYMLSLALAVLMLSLETFPIAIFILFVSYLAFGHYKLISIKNVLLVILVSFVMASIIWPAFLFKGDMFKSVGMYFFRIFGKSNLEYKDVSYLGNWINVVKYSPIFSILILGQLFYSSFNWKDFFKNNSLINFLFFFGILYCVIMTPFVMNINYIFPGIIVLFISVSLFYLELIKDKKKQIVLFLSASALSVINMVYLINQEDTTLQYNFEKDQLIEDYELIKSLRTSGPIIGYGGERYSYIEKDSTIFDLDNAVKNHGKFTHRFDYNHSDLKEDFLNRKYELIFLSDGMNSREENVKRVVEEFGYKYKVEGKEIVVYSYKKLNKNSLDE